MYTHNWEPGWGKYSKRDHIHAGNLENEVVTLPSSFKKKKKEQKVIIMKLHLGIRAL